MAISHHLLQASLINSFIVETELRGENIVEDDAPDAGLNPLPVLLLLSDLNLSPEVNAPQFIGEHCLLKTAED